MLRFTPEGLVKGGRGVFLRSYEQYVVVPHEKRLSTSHVLQLVTLRIA